jgi:1,6-anhydro-N-acetylmuramate kinase
VDAARKAAPDEFSGNARQHALVVFSPCQIEEIDAVTVTISRQIKEARRAAAAAPTLEEKLAGQKQIKALESQRNEKCRSLFDAQDEVDRQRDRLIAEIERKLQQHLKTVPSFFPSSAESVGRFRFRAELS